MLAIEVAARDAGYFVSLAGRRSPPLKAPYCSRTLQDQAAGPRRLPRREWIAAAVVAADLPVVAMCADSFDPAEAGIGVDRREAGGKVATDHLIDWAATCDHRGEDVPRQRHGADFARRCAGRPFARTDVRRRLGPRADAAGLRCWPRGSRQQFLGQRPDGTRTPLRWRKPASQFRRRVGGRFRRCSRRGYACRR